VIEETHKKPENFKEIIAKNFIWLLRGTYDIISGYHEEEMSEKKWLTRCIFLEPMAVVPGTVGGMTRHLNLLRTMRPDHGIVHHLHTYTVLIK